MKSLTTLLQYVFDDVSNTNGTTITIRDKLYVAERVKKEGISFLTITLPILAQALERGLETGCLDEEILRPFKKLKGSGTSGRIPCLFSGIFLKVFDRTGRLLDDPSVAAISALRQICLMWKKIRLPCKEERVSAAMDSYVECDEELAMIDLSCFKDVVLEQVSEILWGDISQRLSELVDANQLFPKHGPGATADRISGNQKYVLQYWHQRLEPYFPFDMYGSSSWNDPALLEDPDGFFREPGAELPVRVISVPKTLKAPRIIAIEPVCMQYAQQAVATELCSEIERGPFTKGHVNFSDQSVNASLALSESRIGKYATLDMKEASDRVHLGWIDLMFGQRSIKDAILACRSTTAELPNGQTIQIKKFASMGSALCFPIEAMAFFTAIVYARVKELRRSPSRRLIATICKDVYVYGDDLIIPVDWVEPTIRCFETFGFKTNTHKSFWNGKFRESCGVDAYDGHDVTVTYVRSEFPRSRRSLKAAISWVELSNQLHKKGYWNSAQWIEDQLKEIGLRFPIREVDASYIGYVRPLKDVTVHRYCKRLHLPVVKAYVVSVPRHDDQITGYHALMKCWLMNTLYSESKHLQRTEGRGALTVKHRWCPVTR